jgi:hypothetical protein
MNDAEIRILQNQLEILRRQAPLLRRITAALGIAHEPDAVECATEKMITHAIIDQVRSECPHSRS